MHRALTGIVIIAVLALVAFGLAGTCLVEKTPRVHVQRALQDLVPVRVRSVKLTPRAESGPAVLRVLVESRGATLTADQVRTIAVETAAVILGGEVIPIEYERLEVVSTAGPLAAFPRGELELRIRRGEARRAGPR